MRHFISLLSLVFSVGVAAEQAPSALQVSFGKPTFTHHLTYKKMYSEKPFEKATLYHYDNGLYKIISPGEEHYGIYINHGAFTDAAYSVSYLSLPSVDWQGNVAKHELTFKSDNGSFQQQAMAESDKNIPLQYGTYNQTANTIANPLPLRWDNTAQ